LSWCVRVIVWGRSDSVPPGRGTPARRRQHPHRWARVDRMSTTCSRPVLASPGPRPGWRAAERKVASDLSSDPNAIRYTGRPSSPDIPGGLQYNRARFYSPDLHRFTSEDPIGQAGGINPYTYANSDPADNTDPTGLIAPELLGCAAGAAIRDLIADRVVRVDARGLSRPVVHLFRQLARHRDRVAGSYLHREADIVGRHGWSEFEDLLEAQDRISSICTDQASSAASRADCSWDCPAFG
jgi:RHS repeat-associated protein